MANHIRNILMYKASLHPAGGEKRSYTYSAPKTKNLWQQFLKLHKLRLSDFKNMTPRQRNNISDEYCIWLKKKGYESRGCKPKYKNCKEGKRTVVYKYKDVDKLGRVVSTRCRKPKDLDIIISPKGRKMTYHIPKKRGKGVVYPIDFGGDYY